MTKWWEKIEPLHKSEGDGQRMVWTYVRKVGKVYEYALVTYADDGEFIGAMILNGEKVKFIGDDDQML